MWNTHVNLNDSDLDAIADAGDVKLSAQQRLDLKTEIEAYACLAEAEKDAPAVGGSGRSNDFVDQHIQRPAEIYKGVGGEVTLGRRNPSRENPRGPAKSSFLEFCLKANDGRPKELQRRFNGGQSDGIAIAMRRALR